MKYWSLKTKKNNLNVRQKKRLCNGFLKLAEALPATNAEALHGILVEEKCNCNSSNYHIVVSLI